MSLTFKEELKHLPQQPGIYRMIDSLGNIIYVGKAKNLKNRVSQYFNNQKNRSPKVVEMISNIHTFNYTVTDTELDAFIEECNLIKEIKPRYNRLMKNDRRYSYIKIPSDQYPKVSITYEKADDGAFYFGPFTSRHRVETTIQYLNDFYPIRKCTSPGLVKKVNGCLFRQLGTCLGACTGHVSADEYRIQIERIQQLLNGEDRASIEDLRDRMNRAIKDLDFEKAAQYRDYDLGLRHVIGKQRLVQASDRNKNILAVEFVDAEQAKFFLIKGNKLLQRTLCNVLKTNGNELKQELRQIILNTFVTEAGKRERLTQHSLDEAQLIYSYLKKNKKTIKSFWIPSSRLKGQMSRLDNTVTKIIDQIKCQCYVT